MRRITVSKFVLIITILLTVAFIITGLLILVVKQAPLPTVRNSELMDESFQNISVKNTVIGDTVWIDTLMYRVIE